MAPAGSTVTVPIWDNQFSLNAAVMTLNPTDHLAYLEQYKVYAAPMH